MDIKYDGVVAEQDRYKYSVKQNNKSNIIIFKLAKEQDSITLNPNNHFYIKVRNSGRTFTDKDPNVVVTTNENGTMIFVSWTMLRKVTQFKDIDVQVEYYDSENDIKWQTAIVNINLHDNIPVDEEIESKYPSILAQLQKQIDELKVDIKPPVGGKGIIVEEVEGQNVVSIDEDIVQQKEEGKGLSSNDYTDEDKEKVANSASKEDLDSKVDKEEGQSLMSSEEHTKLAGISPEANKVVVLGTTPNGYIVIDGNQVRVFNDQELRNLIAGKETGWVIDRQDQITGDKDEDDNYNNVTAIEGLDLNQVKVGDNIYIKDREVPDYWVSARTEGSVGVILELTTLSTKIDLTNYFTKQEVINLLASYANKEQNENITGAWAFINGASFKSWTINGSTDNKLYFSLGAGIFRMEQTCFTPNTNNNKDLGANGFHFRNTLTNKLTGETQSANTDDIIKSTSVFKTMNAPASTTLTDDEYATLLSGVPVQIIGSYLGLINPILFAHQDSGQPYILVTGKWVDYIRITAYRLLTSKKLQEAATKLIHLNHIKQINDKDFPDYSKGYWYYNGSALEWKDGILFPPAPADSESKTYVPKLINGVPTWVEEISEDWTFTLDDGSTVTKKVLIKQEDPVKE